MLQEQIERFIMLASLEMPNLIAQPFFKERSYPMKAHC